MSNVVFRAVVHYPELSQPLNGRYQIHEILAARLWLLLQSILKIPSVLLVATLFVELTIPLLNCLNLQRLNLFPLGQTHTFLNN